MESIPTNPETIVMYTTSWCPDCHRAKFLLDEYGIVYEEIDVETDPAARAFVRQVNGGQQVVPTILFPDGSILVEPTTAVLAEKVGISLRDW